MMINKDFVMKKIGNEYIAAAVGNAAKNFNGIIKLNDTSAYIWHCIEPGIEKKTLIIILLILKQHQLMLNI